MRAWTIPDELARHSLDVRQFCDMRLSTLPDGQRIIHAHNAAGLSLSFLPDRGLDIWQAHYRGIPLTWVSAGSPHKADYGQSWLGQFNGGLLTTCGLSNVGPPETDDLSGEHQDIHGNFTRLSARDVNITVTWDGATLTGTLFEGHLFGAQWRVERRFHMAFDQARLDIQDVIVNISDQPAPLMLLYHINLGYPLVREGAKLHTASEQVLPRDDAAEQGVGAWADYASASTDYQEQVFFHRLRHTDSLTAIAFYQGDFGIALHWDMRQLPYFTQWKNTRQGFYVCGIEPGNCIPEGKNAARRSDRLDTVNAGDGRKLGWTLTILDSAEAVQAVVVSIQQIERDGSTPG